MHRTVATIVFTLAALAASSASSLAATPTPAPTPVRLPAPVNDSRKTALPVPAERTTIWGRTTEATVAYTDPRACGYGLIGSVWYRVGNPPAHDLVLRLHSDDQDVLAAFRYVHGKLTSLGCAPVDDNGTAMIGFRAHRDDLVLVGRLESSKGGRFTLSTLVPQPAEHAPGRPLRGGVHSTVERYLDPQDVWNVVLRAGTTYRLRLLGTGVTASMVSPATGKEVAILYGTRYELFTPGPSGGGRYVLFVSAGYGRGPIPYSLRVARAGLDDTGPGRLLRTGTWTDGELDPHGIDDVDLYRFTLATRSDVLLALARPRPTGVTLLLMRDDGSTDAAGPAVRRSLPAGNYAVSVSSSAGSKAVRYRLALRVHQSSRLFIGAKTAAGGTPVGVASLIGWPAGRDATLQVDRLDPLEGWVYDRTYDLPVRSSRTVSIDWLPPKVGYYRLRVTRPSRSGYVYIHVVQPAT